LSDYVLDLTFAKAKLTLPLPLKLEQSLLASFGFYQASPYLDPSTL
jgi:hypothetical protein